MPQQNTTTYRPICLRNVSFKIFMKVVTIHINSITDHLISSTQTMFMRGRNILEGVVTLHETAHELHRKNQSGVIFKIDFEKAYDKVRWNFLVLTLWLKGFSHKWIEWIKSFISVEAQQLMSMMRQVVIFILRKDLGKAIHIHLSYLIQYLIYQHCLSTEQKQQIS